MNVWRAKLFMTGLLGITLSQPASSGQTIIAGQGKPRAEASTLHTSRWIGRNRQPSAAGLPPVQWNFIQVSSVAVTPTGNILVLHRGAHPLMEFDNSGKFMRSWGDGMISEGKVVAIPKEKIVPDRARYSAVYGPAGCNSCGAHSVRVDPQGNIWMIDAAGHVIYKLAPTEKRSCGLAPRGRGNGRHTFQSSDRCGVRFTCDFYVSDGYGNARVVKYSRDGKYLLQWGTRGSGPGQFSTPHNVVADARDRIYVSDRDNQRIQVFDSSGKFLSQWTGTGGISALAITKDQRIWTAGTVRDLDGKVLGTLPGVPGGHGIAATDSGDVYVPQFTGVVQKFVKH